MVANSLQKKRANLPSKPGVYLMKNARGEVIYVGKAKSLKKRVSSYFRPAALVGKTRALVENLADLDYIVTHSELEALILEANLIKKYRPRYNIELKHNQRYPYLKVTVNDEFPRLFSSRHLVKDGAMYFGPYPDLKALRRTLDTIRSLFRLRSCRQRINRKQVCLDYHIERCWGPCEGKITPPEYREQVDEVILFLKGRNEKLIKKLKKQMQEAAKVKDYEKALLLREQTTALKKVAARQVISELKDQDIDVIALEEDAGHYCVVLLIVRSGQILGGKHFFLKVGLDNQSEEIISEFIRRYYLDEDFVPRALLVTELPPENELIEDWLSGKKGVPVKISRPMRGRKRTLLQMAVHNARTFLLAEAALAQAAQEQKPLLEKLQRRLDLKNFPQTIIGIDISNTGGQEAVGSLVVFSGGRKDSKLYRRYKIKSVSGIDDCAMIREVVSRYLKRVVRGEERRADLLLVDGGTGQLNAAISALQEAGFNGIDVVSLAKREEEIYRAAGGAPLKCSPAEPECRLLIRVRDEAHRFAINYHRKRRGKKMRVSLLDRVSGVGPARKRELLKRFGSPDNIKRATVAQIASLPGIGKKRASLILDELKKLS